MPPALHPRSRATASLFTTTLLVSFLVVATPHILPCPVPPTRTDSADPDRPRRRRRKCMRDENGNIYLATATTPTMKADGAEKIVDGDIGSVDMDVERDSGARIPKGRECPVPKPGGLVGQILGFKKEEGGEVPRIVRVEPVRRRRMGRELVKEEDAAS